ncbi:hypothetical protein llg_43420 [Luteolibacter sp. LG18]|nr:hypothetical protein llg_43420 [Luteolibacter sp. LG18]
MTQALPGKPTPPTRPAPPLTQRLTPTPTGPLKPGPPLTQRLTPKPTGPLKPGRPPATQALSGKPTPTARPASPVNQALPGMESHPLRKNPTPTQPLPAKQKATAKQTPKAAETLYEDESLALMSCAVEVAQNLGPGLPDKIYGNALARELELRGIPFIQQIRYSVDYKGKIVGEFIPDLIAYGKIIIETKMIDHITEVEIEHVMNYLRISGHRLALILNFKNSRFETRWVAL